MRNRDPKTCLRLHRWLVPGKEQIPETPFTLALLFSFSSGVGLIPPLQLSLIIYLVLLTITLPGALSENLQYF